MEIASITFHTAALVFGGLVQIFQITTTRTILHFALIAFAVLLFFVGISAYRVHGGEGDSLPLIATNIEQMFSNRMLGGETILKPMLSSIASRF
jgi:multisubunit Na+/H+ antiporter MnhC subunit